MGGAGADGVRRDAPVEDEGARLLVLQRFGQQVVEIEHLDAALLHLQHEVVMVLLRLMDPDHVVEEQVVAVARRQPLMREARAADHDGPQLADFRMDAETACMVPPSTGCVGALRQPPRSGGRRLAHKADAAGQIS